MSIPQGRALRHMFDTIAVLVARDQKARYTSTVMGVVWAVASPLLFLLTFYVLFKVILPMDIPNYAAHLFVGIVVWTWFQGAITESVTCIVGNPGVVSQPGVPVAAIPPAVVSSHFMNFLFTLPVLLVILLSSGAKVGLSLVAIPAILAVMFVFVLAVSYLVAALNVGFRDMQYIVPILLQLGYFATPIFYDTSGIPERPRMVLGFNPMLQFIEASRGVLIRAEWPDWIALGWTFAGSALLLWVAQAVFRRASQRFLEEL